MNASQTVKNLANARHRKLRQDYQVTKPLTNRSNVNESQCSKNHYPFSQESSLRNMATVPADGIPLRGQLPFDIRVKA